MFKKWTKENPIREPIPLAQKVLTLAVYPGPLTLGLITRYIREQRPRYERGLLKAIRKENHNEAINIELKRPWAIVPHNGRWRFEYTDTDEHYNITEERIKEILDKYTLTSAHIKYGIQRFDPDRIIDQYLDFIMHLIIISKYDNGKHKYELSLFGVILILAVIAYGNHPSTIYYNDSYGMDLQTYFEEVALNYRDKLPLVFGKWDLLKKMLITFSFH
jgi:hypothetical protein